MDEQRAGRPPTALGGRGHADQRERGLAENGHAARIIELRHDFQKVMREDLIAIVESHLGRKVIAFMSPNHIDPDLTVEIFVLEPATAT